MRKISIFCTLFSVLCISSYAAREITVYHSPNCMYCHHAIDFINDNLVNEYPDLIVTQVNAALPANGETFRAAVRKCDLSGFGVPLVVIGDRCFQGFSAATGDEYRNVLEAIVPEEVAAAGQGLIADETMGMETETVHAVQTPSNDARIGKTPVFLYALFGIFLLALGTVLLAKKRRKA
ncbi:MAG: hypothetical protein FWG80_01430 [Alphaproteobacteria bacterium]|nr:hypothetical protein [Alphaproteobacteria bacterium]